MLKRLVVVIVVVVPLTFGLGTLGGVPFVAASAHVAGTHHLALKKKHKKHKGPYYKASAHLVAAPTRKTVIVSVKITNVGTRSGKPACDIDVTAPTGANGVTRIGPPHSIKPGKSASTPRVYVRITTTRAKRVTQTEVTITCNKLF